MLEQNLSEHVLVNQYIQKMFVTRYILFLLLLKNLQADLTIDHSPTLIQSYCDNSPTWNLNLCNMTCSSCTPSNNLKCASCYSHYTMTNGYCTLNNNTDIYYYKQYLTNNIFSSYDITSFSQAGSFRSLQVSDSTYVCMNNSYKFQMMGLYSSASTISLLLSYSEVMSAMSIRFNYLTVLSSTTLTVTLRTSTNTIQKTLSFTDFSSLSGNYYRSKNLSEPSYLYITSLTVNNVRSIITMASFQFVANDKDIEIQIQSRSKDANGMTPFWGFSDLVILAQQCSTCPTIKLKSTISKLGYVTLYILAGFTIFITLFACLMKIQDCLRQRKFVNKFANSSYMPLKAVNRLRQSLHFPKQQQLIFYRSSQDIKNLRKTFNEHKYKTCKDLHFT